MENLTYFLDGLNSYSNLLIAILTLAIIYFAYRSLRSSEEAIRLSTFPMLFARVITVPQKTTLIIENHSNYPGYDVDVFIIAQYFEEEVPHKSLLSDKYKNEVEVDFSRNLFGYESEHYSIYDCISYYAFPPNRKVESELGFIVPPLSIEVILQFRDSTGQNYLYQSWLYAEGKKKHLSLTEGSCLFNFKPTSRIKILESRQGLKELFKLPKVTKHINFPTRFLRIIPMYVDMLIAKIRIYLYIDKNIRDSFLRLFPSGYQKNQTHLSVKGRGIFTKL